MRSTDWTPRGFEVQPTGYGNIEAEASRVRQVLTRDKATPASALDCVALFENLHTFRVHKSDTDPIDWIVMEDAGKLEAFTKFHEGIYRLVLTNSVYQGMRRGDARPQFTFCHEVGHLVLHAEKLRSLGEVPHSASVLARGSASHPAFKDSEWQADAFAGALLMPAAGLVLLEQHGVLTVSRVVETYRVSARAASVRLEAFADHRHKMLNGRNF